MSPEAILEGWRREYGATPMLGHVLRARFPQRWLRIHSLPDSKRYAETDDEHREILRRQNDALAEVLEDGAPCAMVFGYYGEEATLHADVTEALLALGPTPLTTLSPDESGLDREYALHVAAFTWRRAALDVILRAVADDVLETPLIMNATQQRIASPYDGGMDVFVESTTRRDELRARYAAWLSHHPAGL